jgi:hypothetical protein
MSVGVVILLVLIGITVLGSVASLVLSLLVYKTPPKRYLLTTMNPLILLFTWPYHLIILLIKITEYSTIKDKRLLNDTSEDIEMGYMQSADANTKSKEEAGRGHFLAHLFGFDVPAIPDLDLGLPNQIPMRVGKMEVADGRSFIGVVSPSVRGSVYGSEASRRTLRSPNSMVESEPSSEASVRASVYDSDAELRTLRSPYSMVSSEPSIEASSSRSVGSSRRAAPSAAVIREGSKSASSGASSMSSYRHRSQLLVSPKGLEVVELE